MAASGLPNQNVIFAYQNGPEPPGPFISIIPNLTITKSGAYDDTIYLPDGSIQTLGFRRILAQVDAYGRNAVGLCCAVQDGLDIPALYQPLSLAGLSIRAISEVRNLTSLKEQRFEERGSLDLEILIRAASEPNNSLGFFDKIQYQGGGTDGQISRIDSNNIEETTKP